MISIFFGIMSAGWFIQVIADQLNNVPSNVNLLVSIGFLCLMLLNIINDKLNHLIAATD